MILGLAICSSASLDFGTVCLDVVGRVNGNCPSLSLLRKQNNLEHLLH